MAFTVPNTTPPLSPYLNPPNAIRGDAVDSLLQRDRFLFATRRRLIFTGGKFDATSGSFVTPFFFSARTSAVVTGNLWVVIAGDEVEVQVVEFNFGGSLTLGVSAGGFETNAQLLTGMPAASTLAMSISARSLGNGNLFGVYIIEEILAAGDLP
jgi:hypothetical protein